MYKFLNSTLTHFVKNRDIKFLIVFGVFYRLFIFLNYTHVTKWPDSWGFMELSTYLLKFDLANYTGERSPGYPILIFLGFWRFNSKSDTVFSCNDYSEFCM